MSNEKTTADRLAAERAFADTLATTLSAEALNRWYACRSTHRIMCFEQKRLIAFHLLLDSPSTLNRFTCEGVSLDLYKGLTSFWRDASGKKITVGHAPVEVAEHCFVWHGLYSSLEYPDHKGRHQVRFSMMWRTLSNIKDSVEGHNYLLEETTYKNLYSEA